MAFNKTKIVNDENIKIPPEELIDSGMLHTILMEYDVAEKEFIAARINSMGTANESYIGKKAKQHLAFNYCMWMEYSIKNHDFTKAKQVLEKLEKIDSDPESARKKYRDAYDRWVH